MITLKPGESKEFGVQIPLDKFPEHIRKEIIDSEGGLREIKEIFNKYKIKVDLMIKGELVDKKGNKTPVTKKAVFPDDF